MKRGTEVGRHLRRVRGTVSIEGMATRLGINKNTLGAYERGERLPEVDFLAEFASITGADFCELLALRLAGSRSEASRRIAAGRAARAAEPDPGDDYVFVPYARPETVRRCESATDGPPRYGSFGFRRSWLEEQGLNPTRLVLVTVRGDAMAHTLRHGDVLLVDTTRRCVVDEGLYVLSSGHGRLVKRLQLLPCGRIRISSDNAAYADLDVPCDAFSESGDSEYRVFGRVVWAGSRL